MAEQFFVNYTVNTGVLVDMQAGPYPTNDIAEEQKRDIAGYHGVTNVWISTQRDPKRKLTA